LLHNQRTLPFTLLDGAFRRTAWGVPFRHLVSLHRQLSLCQGLLNSYLNRIIFPILELSLVIPRPTTEASSKPDHLDATPGGAGATPDKAGEQQQDPEKQSLGEGLRPPDVSIFVIRRFSAAPHVTCTQSPDYALPSQAAPDRLSESIYRLAGTMTH